MSGRQGRHEQRQNWGNRGQDGPYDQPYRGGRRVQDEYDRSDRRQGVEYGPQGGSWNERSRGGTWSGGWRGDAGASDDWQGNTGRGQEDQDSGNQAGWGSGWYGGQFGQQQGGWPRGEPYGQQGWQGNQQTGRFAGRGPKGYQRSDERLRDEVNDRLTWDGDVDATNIEVVIEHGVVTLNGTVDDRQQKRAAEECAYQVQGVRDVNNHIRIEREQRVSGHQMEEGQYRETGEDEAGRRNETRQST